VKRTTKITRAVHERQFLLRKMESSIECAILKNLKTLLEFIVNFFTLNTRLKKM
jgi:hypothetical protein